ncbi:MAG: Tetratricopeptide repeat-containing protein [Ferruginibacter sp.]|nr:Tetratricopeptide repeat-containing protein [Ferruginibacter sp.]
MKKNNGLQWVLAISLGLVIHSCNSGGSGSPKSGAAPEVTEIPAYSNSKDAQSSFREGMAALDLGDFTKARTLFTKAIQLDSSFGTAYLMKANTATSAKEYADDIMSGKSHLDSASNWEKMYGEYLATNLAGDRIKGIGILEKIAAAYPKAARAQVDLAAAYSDNNQLDKARAGYQKAVELDPEWTGAYTGMINDYLFNEPKDLKKAQESALKLVVMAPASSGAAITLGDCYRAQNDFSKAKEAYAKAVQLDGSAAAAYYKEGHANTYLGNFDEARKNYMDAGKRDVSPSFSILNIAYTYLYGGDSKTAMKVLTDGAAKLDSSGNTPGKMVNEKSNCFTSAANIAEHYGDASALKQLVAKIEPLNEQVFNDLGTAEGKIFGKADLLGWQARIAIAEGKLDEAKAKAEDMKSVLASIKDDRKDEDYHYLMGVISMRQKNFPDAIAHLEKGDRNRIYIKYLMARANEAGGNKDKATALYKEVAAYNFNDIGNALVRNEVRKKLGMM